MTKSFVRPASPRFTVKCWPRRSGVGLLAALAAIATTGAISDASVASPAVPAPQMYFDPQLAIRTACFSVVNPEGSRSALYGQRFTDGPVSSATPAIVLVHGAASSTASWDFSPRWSVARALASAGYVVFSYDRLGFAESSYLGHPGGGNTLTTAVQRHLLHQVVSDVKAGHYATAGVSTCSGSRQASELTSRKVIIVGHSSGGWVVAGYPGEYHDVAAMIQADITASVQTPPAPGGSFTSDPTHSDYYQLFQTRSECETFNIYPPGAVRYVVAIACAAPFEISPWGEIKGLGQTYTDNATYIPRIGHRIAVLLTSGEHDTTAPPAAARKDFAYYQSNCRCNVSQFIVANTAHLFMAHTSLTTWVDHVVSWLSSRGMRPTVAATSALARDRRRARGFVLNASPEQVAHFPLRFRASGRLLLWSGMSASEWCSRGLVEINVQAGGTTVLTGTAPLRRNCTYRHEITVHDQSQLGAVSRLSIIAQFAGDDALRMTGPRSVSFTVGRG